MTVRTFALIVGTLLALGAFIGLALPVSVDNGDDTVSCGNALRGLSLEAQRSEDIADAFGSEPSGIVDDCEDGIGTRRSWGWPLVGIGVVVALGALVIRQPVAAHSERPPVE